MATYDRCISVMVERFRDELILPVRKVKLCVPANMTVLRLSQKIRNRFLLPSNISFHLMRSNGLPLVMSQKLRDVPRDDPWELHVLCSSESTFGCPRPRIKCVGSKFPSSEPIPFGAPEPEPYFGMFLPLQPLPDEEVGVPEQVPVSNNIPNILHELYTQSLASLLPPLSNHIGGLQTEPAPQNLNQTGLSDPSIMLPNNFQAVQTNASGSSEQEMINYLPEQGINSAGPSSSGAFQNQLEEQQMETLDASASQLLYQQQMAEYEGQFMASVYAALGSDNMESDEEDVVTINGTKPLGK